MNEHRAAELTAAGRLRESARALALTPALSTAGRVMACYVQSETGDALDAERMAQELLRGRMPLEHQAYSFEILARLALKLGRLNEGVRYYGRSVECAKSCREPQVLSRVLTTLVPALTHAMGVEEGVPEIRHLRRAAFSAGDVAALTSLHLLIAESEAKRGNLGQANHHLQLAEGHLRVRPHLVLQAQYHLVATGLFDRGSALRDAMAHAMEAMKCAEEAGALTVLIPALGNLAHEQLTNGEFDECRASLDLALEIVRPGGGAELGLRDTEVQLLMVCDDLEQADRFNAELLRAPRSLSDPYHSLWHKLTTVRLLLRTDRAPEAVALALEAIPRIERMADRNLLVRMRLLAAEGLGRVGRAAEGAALHAEAILSMQDPPLDVVAEASRVAGRLATGHLPAALDHFERAGRILWRIGNVTARQEVARHAGECLDAHRARETRAATLDHDLPCLLGPADAGRRLDDGAPRVEDRRPSAARAVEAAAAAFNLAGHPSLMGQELVSLLHGAAATRAAALVEVAEGQSPRPVLWTGCTADEAAALSNQAGAIVFSLGTERAREYRVAIQPADGVESRTTVAAIEHLARSARALDEARRLERERAALWPEETPEQQLGFIVASESMTDLVKTMRRVAAGNAPVLITGETGTGKELLARALHDTSPRREKPFVPFNCTAVARDMLDSQLFGYRRGAFTGAQEAFPGVIRAATGGTLLLDEIGELSLDVQPKLLRFLESGEVHPLGETTPRVVDVRVVAATNRSLDQLIAAGTFREDLYYRLNVVRLEIPALRERCEEIPLLVEHFLEKWSTESQKTGLRVAEETMEYLVLYRWPGNVRELANELRRMVALAEDGAVLMPEHLSPAIAASRRTLPASDRALEPTELVVRTDQPLAAAIEHLERAMVVQALRLHGHRVEDAAQHLGISRKGLYLKRQRLGVD